MFVSSLPLQKVDVLVSRGAADVADPRQLGHIELSSLVGGIVAKEARRNVIGGHLRSADLLPLCLCVLHRGDIDIAELFEGELTDGFVRYRNSIGNIKFNRLIEEIKKLNTQIVEDPSLGEGFQIGHSFFCELDKENIGEELRSVVDEEIIPLLSEYWFDEPKTAKEWSDNLRGALR